jgi:hypothetical protein
MKLGIKFVNMLKISLIGVFNKKIYCFDMEGL